MAVQKAKKNLLPPATSSSPDSLWIGYMVGWKSSGNLGL
jgi:hypothetical protein